MKLLKLIALATSLLVTSSIVNAKEIDLTTASQGAGGGCYGMCGSLRVEAKVENLAYSKVVKVHYKVEDGEWLTGKLNYATSSDDNFEKWVYYTNTSGGPSAKIKFYLSYEVNGTTYYDNNNGHDYHSSENFSDYSLNEVALVSAAKGTGGGCYGLCADLTVDVQVQNIAYSKEVFIVYSVDGGEWNKSSFGKYEQSNEDGTEIWTIYLPYIFPTDLSVEFAVGYTVDGETYWDNNNGVNYIR